MFMEHRGISFSNEEFNEKFNYLECEFKKYYWALDTRQDVRQDVHVLSKSFLEQVDLKTLVIIHYAINCTYLLVEKLERTYLSFALSYPISYEEGFEFLISRKEEEQQKKHLNKLISKNVKNNKKIERL